jgi:ectoine hydroxylase
LEIEQRIDPVIWTAKERFAEPLSKQQLDFYSRNGFLFFPNVLTPNLSNLASVGTKEASSQDRKESFIYEKDETSLRSIYNAHNLSSKLYEFVKNKFFVEIAQQILASQVYLYQSQINYKKSFSGTNFFWHHDYTYWHYEDGMPQMRALGFVTFLDDVSYENGPIMMISGSHLWKTNFNWKLRSKDIKKSIRHDFDNDRENNGLLSNELVSYFVQNGKIQTITGAKGSVLLYDCNTVHASSDNISPWDRTLYLAFYNSVHNGLVNPTRPDYITEREILPL